MNLVPERIAAQLRALEERLDQAQAVIASLSRAASKAEADRSALEEANAELHERLRLAEEENRRLRGELNAVRSLTPERRAELLRLLEEAASIVDEE